MDQITKGQIEWFLSLANMSIEDRHFGEILYLVQNMKIFFGKTLHPDLSGLGSVDLPPEMAEAEMTKEIEILQRLQLKVNQFLNDILQRYEEAGKYKDERKALNVFGFSEIVDLRTLDQMEIKVNAKIMIRNSPKLKPIRGISTRKQKVATKQWIAFWDGNTLETSPFELVITPEEGDEGFLFSFAQALHNIPLKSIKKCSECSDWFLQSGKKERLFCSNNCRARKYNKDRRKAIKEEGGEKYKTELKNGRKRAKKSYNRKIQKKLGKNVKIGPKK